MENPGLKRHESPPFLKVTHRRTAAPPPMATPFTNSTGYAGAPPEPGTERENVEAGPAMAGGVSAPAVSATNGLPPLDVNPIRATPPQPDPNRTADQRRRANAVLPSVNPVQEAIDASEQRKIMQQQMVGGGEHENPAYDRAQQQITQKLETRRAHPLHQGAWDNSTLLPEGMDPELQPRAWHEEDNLVTYRDPRYRPTDTRGNETSPATDQAIIRLKDDVDRDEMDPDASHHYSPEDVCATCYGKYGPKSLVHRWEHQWGPPSEHEFEPLRMEPGQRYSSAPAGWESVEPEDDAPQVPGGGSVNSFGPLCERCWLDYGIKNPSPEHHGPGWAHEFTPIETEPGQRYSSWDMLEDRPKDFNLPEHYRQQGLNVNTVPEDNLAYFRDDNNRNSDGVPRGNPSARMMFSVQPDYYVPHADDDTADPREEVDTEKFRGDRFDPETEPCADCWYKDTRIVPKDEHDYDHIGKNHPWRSGAEGSELSRFGSWDINPAAQRREIVQRPHDGNEEDNLVSFSRVATQALHEAGLKDDLGDAFRDVRDLAAEKAWGIKGLTQVIRGDLGHSMKAVRNPGLYDEEGNVVQEPYRPPVPRTGLTWQEIRSKPRHVQPTQQLQPHQVANPGRVRTMASAEDDDWWAQQPDVISTRMYQPTGPDATGQEFLDDGSDPDWDDDESLEDILPRNTSLAEHAHLLRSGFRWDGDERHPKYTTEHWRDIHDSDGNSTHAKEGQVIERNPHVMTPNLDENPEPLASPWMHTYYPAGHSDDEGLVAGHNTAHGAVRAAQQLGLWGARHPQSQELLKGYRYVGSELPYDPSVELPHEQAMKTRRTAAFDSDRGEFLYDIDSPGYHMFDQPPSAGGSTAQPMALEKDVPYQYFHPEEDSEGYLSHPSDAALDSPYHHGHPFCKGCFERGLKKSPPPESSVHDLRNKPTAPNDVHEYEPMEDLPPGARLAAFDPGRQEFLYNIEGGPDYYKKDKPPSAQGHSAQPLMQEKDLPYEGYENRDIPGEHEPADFYRWDAPMEHSAYPFCKGCFDRGSKESAWPDDSIHQEGSNDYHAHEYEPMEELSPGQRLAAGPRYEYGSCPVCDAEIDEPCTSTRQDTWGKPISRVHPEREKKPIGKSPGGMPERF